MVNTDIDFYCRTYDNFLSTKDCEEYIDKYEETLRVDNDKWKNLSVCISEDGKALDISKFQKAVNQYEQDCNIDKVQWPKDFGWEELRIKRYKVTEQGNHGLSDHVDVYSHAHAKRFLCLMVYLNDDFADGETFFPLFNSKVKPQQGRLFIFPPTWNYLHRGIPPRSPSKRGAKYFVMTHLNYIDLSLVNKGTSFTDRKIATYDLNTKKMTKDQLLWPKS